MSEPTSLDRARQILVAEDSPTQAQRLRHLLEQQGYRVTTAADGALALEAARTNRPALIISDVMMPQMTGYELCRRIKADPDLQDIPVILVTTLSDPQDVIRGLECGADNFILKPYETEGLLRRVKFLLGHGRPPPGAQLEVVFGGQKHRITADRARILTLLLSTYEAAVERNGELTATRDALRRTNLELQQLTHALEDRVRERTSELERSNEQVRQAQQALIQQERLRALGQMASGIAHDINNAISPISLYADLLLDHEPGLSPAGREHLETIQRAIDDVARTVARMREFYRPQEPQLQSSDIEINPLVHQVIDLTRARWSDQPQRAGIMIELRAELAAHLPVVRGAENEIRDALTNLIFNAVDAVPTGGVIEIRTAMTPTGMVQLEVRDTGVGMDEETRKRCLEPFFTTKGERGTGLGLAMVYGMAQRHRAQLQIESARGHGTTMRLLFPANEHAAQPIPGLLPPLEPSRGLRILVIDDDTLLSQSLSTALRSEGHEVTVADGGQAGIDAFQPGHFEVVITDLGMPYVDGRQVARAIRSASPATPIIMLTGWGRSLQAEGVPPEVDRVLNKPPRLGEIRAALAELTEGRPS